MELWDSNEHIFKMQFTPCIVQKKLEPYEELGPVENGCNETQPGQNPGLRRNPGSVIYQLHDPGTSLSSLCLSFPTYEVGIIVLKYEGCKE